MKRWVAAAIILVLFVLQITVAPYFRIFSTQPDLILIGVITVALFCDRRWALLSGLCAGALKDAFTAQTPGINVVLLFLWSVLAIKASRRFSLDFNGSRAILVGVFAFSQAVIIRLIYFYLGISVPFGIFLRIAFLGSVYTALVSLAVFKVLRIK